MANLENLLSMIKISRLAKNSNYKSLEHLVLLGNARIEKI